MSNAYYFAALHSKIARVLSVIHGHRHRTKRGVIYMSTAEGLTNLPCTFRVYMLPTEIKLLARSATIKRVVGMHTKYST